MVAYAYAAQYPNQVEPAGVLMEAFRPASATEQAVLSAARSLAFPVLRKTAAALVTGVSGFISTFLNDLPPIRKSVPEEIANFNS